MLSDLKFVQGAIAKKTLIPTLNHFRIQDGTVRSFNGSLALCSPIQLDINCVPKALPFIKAIQGCDDTVSLSLTATGRLKIVSGNFKAFIDCVDEETPHVTPEGDVFPIEGEELLAALKIMLPFISTDASRPWSTGAMLNGQSVYATNNIMLVQYWVGSNFPVICNLPAVAIKEMVRINEPPVSAQATDKSISFHYPDGRWIRTATISTDWPDLDNILNTECNATPIDKEIFNALDVISPFADDMGRVYIKDDVICTSLTDNEGAHYNIDGLGFEGIYQIEMLKKLEKIATSADFTHYPAPCIFYGERLRGAIIGLKL